MLTSFALQGQEFAYRKLAPGKGFIILNNIVWMMMMARNKWAISYRTLQNK